LIAAKFFSLTWIGVVMPDAPIRELSATSFQRGQMKNARSFFFAIVDCSSPMITVRETCYFTSARKLGVGSAPMSACLDAFAATLGVPAAAPWVAGDWRVTCAVY
jgi:hypothetical protein